MTGTVIFDLDGTLVDSAPDLHAAALGMLSAAGLTPVTIERTRNCIGNGIPTLVARLMKAVGAGDDPALHARLLADFQRRYAAAPAERSTLYQGVADALDALAAMGHPIAICTNKTEGPARSVLDAFGLSHHVAALVGGDTVTSIKPDPAPLLHAASGLGTDRAVFVGDSEVDSETAARAGIPFALHTGGYRKTPVADLAHQGAFDDYARLPDLVADLMPAR